MNCGGIPSEEKKMFLMFSKRCILERSSSKSARRRWCWGCRHNFTGPNAAYKAMLHVGEHAEELNEELKSEWGHGMFDSEEDGYTIYNFLLREDPSAEAEYLGVPVFFNLPSGIFDGFAGGRELMHWESSEQPSNFF